MKRHILKVLATLVLAVVALPGAQNAHAAQQLEIQFLGLDLAYDGTDLYDAQSSSGGVGNPADADPLTTVKFLVDGVQVGTLTSDISADIYIAGVLGIPVGGGAVSSTGNGDNFGFDILTSAAGWGLALDIDTANVFYIGQGISISGGGLATKVPAQSLPFGLMLDDTQPVTFAFSSANVSNLTDDGTSLTGFRASGTGNIRAMLVPEPGSAALMLFGTLGLVLRRRR